MTVPTSSLFTKIFIGFPLSSSWKFLLKESLLFQHTQIHPQSEEVYLQIIRFKSKDYLGFYLQETLFTIPQIRLLEQKAKDQIQNFCSQKQAEKLTFVVFPQLHVC